MHAPALVKGVMNAGMSPCSSGAVPPCCARYLPPRASLSRGCPGVFRSQQAPPTWNISNAHSAGWRGRVSQTDALPHTCSLSSPARWHMRIERGSCSPGSGAAAGAGASCWPMRRIRQRDVVDWDAMRTAQGRRRRTEVPDGGRGGLLGECDARARDAIWYFKIYTKFSISLL